MRLRFATHISLVPLTGAESVDYGGQRIESSGFNKEEEEKPANTDRMYVELASSPVKTTEQWSGDHRQPGVKRAFL